ncbi:hypothetical protein F5882DRAFT_299593 [Hyaloscypha sp. PMI_1271]|nr:hypothetical protein F5882DRAFT_299593 [Hyaloscypha sp. PMI_1271]
MVSQDSEKQFQAEQIETRQQHAKPGFGQKAKRHCSRFWWLHLIIFCVIFLIVALCLVYVGMPKIAQHGVDESWMEVTELKFLEPTSNSVVLTQEVILHSPSIFTPTLDSFTAASWLVTNGTFGPTPMMMIPMPKIHALHPVSNAGVQNVNLSIASLEQVTEYSTAIISQESVTTALTGKTKLHEGKLPVVNIDYNSSSTYKGLNGLKGFNVTDVRLNSSAKAGEPNLKGFAYIPNPSVITVALGNVTLTLSTAKAGVVGNTTINDMTLVPGNNILPMTGIVDQVLIASSLNATGWVTLSIQGESAIYNGQHLTYYEAPLKSNVLSLDMNIVQVLADSASSS